MHYESARQFVVSVIAAALQATVAVVERMLPFRPDWLERIDILAAEFRAVEKRGSAPRTPTPRPSRRPRRRPLRPTEASTEASTEAPAELPGEATADDDPARVIAAYNELWRFVQQVKEQGLSMDDAFCERVRQDWSTTTLLGYVRAIETSLRDRATKAQLDAAGRLAPEQRA